MPETEPLPDYAPMLSAYHRAYADELRATIADLPIRAGDRVLDVACGDGSYSGWLAERVGRGGRVVGVDVSPAFLEWARRNVPAGPVEFVEAALERLPFPEGSFDLVWCAQSLYSLPEPVEAVRHMARAVRPGGVVAVLENDSLHHVLLPWPIEIELAARRAELIGLAEESDEPRKFYVGRQLRQIFREAGLVRARQRSRASNREAPLDRITRDFLDGYLKDLRERVSSKLEGRARDRFERMTDPSAASYLLNDPDLVVTCLDHVVTGSRPDARS